MNPEDDPQVREFEQRSRALLAQGSDALSGELRSRLARARHAALAQRPRPAAIAGLGAVLARHRWLPTGAVAAAVLAVVLLTVQPRVPAPQLAAAGGGGDDIELLADGDALALAQEQDVDYDFYEWAVGAAQDDAGAAVGT